MWLYSPDPAWMRFHISLLVQLDTIFNESTTSEAVCIGRVSDIAISTHDVSTWTHDVLNVIDLQTEGTLQFKKGFLCIFLSSLGSSDGCLFGLRQLGDVLILLCYLSSQLLDCKDLKSNLILILARAVNTDSPLYNTNVQRRMLQWPRWWHHECIRHVIIHLQLGLLHPRLPIPLAIVHKPVCELL